MSEKKSDSVQSKMDRLEKIVQWFESDKVDIEEALKKYEEGLKLIAELQKDIKTAKNKFTKIKQTFN